MTRVLVVDDSRLMRSVVGDALEDAGYEVETAVDGDDAVETVATFDPDVVTMDLEMPGTDGSEAVERIMSTNPTSILLVSAHAERRPESVLDALERGAVDVLQKPDRSNARTLSRFAETVVEKVTRVADANVSTLALAQATAVAHRARSKRRDRTVPAGDTGAGADTDADADEDADGDGADTSDDDELRNDEPAIVVGASTGGPKIVERFVERLPRSLDAKLLIVQHMPAAFTERFADRLDAISDYDVREAADDDLIGAGDALVAPGGRHLEVVSNVGGTIRVRLSADDRVHGVRPSIDVTMRTAADRISDPLVGVVLTGMGRDGARGIEAVKEAGGRTFAQDERSSPVFGIPRQAIETGAVDEVVPADELVNQLVDLFSKEGDSHG